MENKISILGVGPKLGHFSSPYLIMVILLLIFYPNFLRMDFVSPETTLFTGLIFALIGLLFYIISIKTLLSLFKTGKLIKSNTFALCRNPIYASFILFLVPAAALFTRSWLILFGSVILYAIFKITIKEETEYLEKAFGDEYKEYVSKVNEIIPFPRFWKNH